MPINKDIDVRDLMEGIFRNVWNVHLGYNTKSSIWRYKEAGSIYFLGVLITKRILKAYNNFYVGCKKEYNKLNLSRTNITDFCHSRLISKLQYSMKNMPKINYK